MNWDAIGAIGEVVGAFGVIVSLLYLRMMLRQVETRRACGVPLLLLLTTACTSTISLPLGGVTAGRGQALGAHTLQFSSSFGTFAEVAGSLPLLTDSLEQEINPIPSLGGGGSRDGGLDLLGFSYGLTDWFDVGLSFSRGLHGFFRIVGNDTWARSASPSVYRHSAEAGGDSGVEARRGAVTNLSVTTLGSYRVPFFADRRAEVYGGGAMSRYSAWIATDAARVEGRHVVPSLLVGFRSLRIGRRTSGPSGEREVFLGMSVEGGWTWVSQRSGRRDSVPTVRVYLTLGGESGE